MADLSPAQKPTRTAAQVATSRRNGGRSKGPVTPEGKARSAMNARRHGFRGRSSGIVTAAEAEAMAARAAAIRARFSVPAAVPDDPLLDLARAMHASARLDALATEERPSRALSPATIARYRGRARRRLRACLAALAEALRTIEPAPSAEIQTSSPHRTNEPDAPPGIRTNSRRRTNEPGAGWRPGAAAIEWCRAPEVAFSTVRDP